MVSFQHPGLNAQTNIQTLKELFPTLARPWYDMLKMMLINRSLSTFHFVKGGRASISSAPSTNNIMHTGQKGMKNTMEQDISSRIKIKNYSFLAKIQNRSNKKSGMKILLLSKFLVV